MYNYLGTKLFLYLSFLISDGSLAKKVMGGREAKQGEFPFSVRIGGGTLCGGSLFTLKKLVSAAHCFEKEMPTGEKKKRDLNISYVIGGTITYKEKSGGYQRRGIESYKLAKGAKKKESGGVYNDLAVAELDKPFEESDTLKLMTIKSTDPEKFKESWGELVKSEEKCTTVGWGAIKDATKDDPNVNSDALKVMEFELWNDERCSEMVSEKDKDMTKEGDICASPVNLGDKVMPGDSGGPLICSGMVWGVLSSCGKKKSTSTSTCHFMLFYNHIKELNLTEANTAITTALNVILKPLIIFPILLCYILY